MNVRPLALAALFLSLALSAAPAASTAESYLTGDRDVAEQPEAFGNSATLHFSTASHSEKVPDPSLWSLFGWPTLIGAAVIACVFLWLSGCLLCSAYAAFRRACRQRMGRASNRKAVLLGADSGRDRKSRRAVVI